MNLVQILLPVYGNDGRALLHDTYDAIRDELVARFGGLTAFTQSPAEGLWNPGDGTPLHDEIIMIEVMVSAIEHQWWSAFRKRLEERLGQQSIVIRVWPMEQL
jgi:hypothetical protein